ncbi:ubiquinone-binding protein [Vandammella animalimorsus]|uniref:Ubiquinone-binding protein n=1 Tax=Vandammella animalimorsus TaxID=2029117 RepID=A0A2A2T4R3_9BURK|nr:type II toxin-antitoxin system RatA family toxin [Vandammella animalimorsus]PAT31940.1 ubiquinone-binding protein [Vandammella animalimorsus]PAX16546.1 ubiquinone-binding protein [Vandammella animalimorsus]PAX18961.1 ubiquinone-binding protein [Vandammella animalimorsus]RRD67549.1 type II toxin-antitoxin system RatA family toxin [Comamonadaceae bacterium OH2310_COT-174]
MKHVEKSALVWFSPAQMFALVTDVASYPQFLPWCDQARVLEQDEHGMLAEVGMAFARVRQSFVTRNEHVGQERVRMQLVRGPFSTLQGEWTFQPIGGQSAEQSQACKVGLVLSYDFDSAALRLLVGPVFDKIANTLVQAFVQRAEQLYGKPA